MNVIKNKKIVYVELARIVACLMIVGYHICLTELTVNDSYIFSRVLFQSVFDDGVTIFWFIAGFFLYDNKKYINLLKKAFYKMWIPATILGIIGTVAYYIYLMIFKEIEIVLIDVLKNMFVGIISFKSFAPSGAHLWFVYIYILLIIIQPFINKIVKILDNSKTLLMVFIIITLFSFIANDFYSNKIFCFGTNYIKGLLPAIIISIYGHVLKTKIYCFNNCNLLLLVILIFAMVLTKSEIVLYCMKNDISCNIPFWYSLYSIMESMVIIVICYVLTLNISERSNETILKFGSKTFYIYLFHPYFCKLFNKIGVFSILKKILNVDKCEFCVYLYTIISICLIVVITIVFVNVLYNLKNVYKKYREKYE